MYRNCDGDNIVDMVCVPFVTVKYDVVIAFKFIVSLAISVKADALLLP